MKKTILFSIIIISTVVSAISQTIVGTNPTPRNAVLEVFGGIN